MFTLNQAAQASPVLAAIAERIRLSQTLLRIVLPLVPPGLRSQLAAGPLEGSQWCVLVTNAAVATKLRHLRPAVLAALRSAGHPIDEIRLKIRTPQ